MAKRYVSLDIDEFEKRFKVFDIEALSNNKRLYLLSAQVGNVVYTALIGSIYAAVLIREQQELVDEINSIGRSLRMEVI